MSETQRIGLVVVVKDEVYDIAGWLAWHLALGFGTIFVFDDRSSDGTDQIVKSASALFDVRYVRLAQDCGHFYDRQQNAYKKMLVSLRDEFSWLCFLDSDEYLLLRKAATVADFLRHYPDAHGIAINWCLYGSDDHILRPLVPPPAAYLRHSSADEGINRHVKSFVRPGQVDVEVEGGMHNVHCFRVGADRYVDTDGHTVNWSRTPGIIQGQPLWNTALIMHFQCRSMEHFLDRARRRRDVHIDVASWINPEWNKEHDDFANVFHGRMFEILTQIELQNSRTLCRLIGSLDGEVEPTAKAQQATFKIFTLRSHLDTTVQVNSATNLLVHAPAGHREGLQPAFLVASADESSKVLLVRAGETSRPFRVENNRQAVVLLALHLAGATSDAVTLQTPTTRLFLTAAPPGPDGIGDIRVNTRRAREWEIFRCNEADAAELDLSVTAMLDAYFTLLSEPPTVELLTRWISSNPLRTTAPLLQILLRQLPKPEQLRLASLLSAVVAPELLAGSQYS